jgi:hypothetical protein
MIIHIDDVKKYLNILNENNEYFKNILIESIFDFRCQMGYKKIKSLADSYALKYKKRGLNTNRRFNGKILNIIEINYKEISKYLVLLEKKGCEL